MWWLIAIITITIMCHNRQGNNVSVVNNGLNIILLCGADAQGLMTLMTMLKLIHYVHLTREWLVFCTCDGWEAMKCYWWLLTRNNVQIHMENSYFSATKRYNMQNTSGEDMLQWHQRQKEDWWLVSSKV